MSEHARPVVAITGANGYVGGALRAAFDGAGYRVIALQRCAPQGGRPEDYIRFSLEDGLEQALPDDVVAVIHCACDLRERSRTEIERINLLGTQHLLDEIGPVPVVLISSMSAYRGTTQIYGQMKLACENLVAQHGGTSLRLGLVHGAADARGMIGALRRVAASPVVPMPSPDSFQYTVHVDDMVRCVIATVENPPPQPILGVANPRRVPFSEIIRGLRTINTSAPLRSVPISGVALYRLLRAAEVMGPPINFRADSLLGLIYPAPEVLYVEHWARDGIILRDFVNGFAPIEATPVTYHPPSST
ncbi:hypothetical protein BH09ACT7_BH09ACT7_06200 [soil metagenome]